MPPAHPPTPEGRAAAAALVHAGLFADAARHALDAIDALRGLSPVAFADDPRATDVALAGALRDDYSGSGQWQRPPPRLAAACSPHNNPPRPSRPPLTIAS